MRKYLVIASATLIGWLVAINVVKGNGFDHRGWQSATERLECLAGEFRDAFREQFRESGNYRELVRYANDFRRDSARLDSLLRRQEISSCDLEETFDELFLSIHRMATAIDIARERASRGLDAPLCGCTLHLDGKLDEAQRLVMGLYRNLVGRGRPFPDRPWGGRDFGPAPVWNPGLGRDQGQPAYEYRDQFSRGQFPRERFETNGFVPRNNGIDRTISLNHPSGRGIDFHQDGGIELRLGVGNVRIR